MYVKYTDDTYFEMFKRNGYWEHWYRNVGTTPDGRIIDLKLTATNEGYSKPGASVSPHTLPSDITSQGFKGAGNGFVYEFGRFYEKGKDPNYAWPLVKDTNFSANQGDDITEYGRYAMLYDIGKRPELFEEDDKGNMIPVEGSERNPFLRGLGLKPNAAQARLWRVSIYSHAADETQENNVLTQMSQTISLDDIDGVQTFGFRPIDGSIKQLYVTEDSDIRTRVVTQQYAYGNLPKWKFIQFDAGSKKTYEAVDRQAISISVENMSEFYLTTADGAEGTGFWIFLFANYLNNPLLEDQTETTEDTKVVHREIEYVTEDGEELFNPITQVAEFTREKQTNTETGDVTYGEWNAESEILMEILSPRHEDYYADIETVEQVTVTPDTEDIYVRVVYKPYYAITTSAVNGTITDNVTGIKAGENKTISYTPDEGYYLRSVVVNGESVDINTYPEEYAFTNIQKNNEIKVTFSPYNQIETEVIGGTIDPDITNIKAGETKEIKYGPNSGYVLKSVTIDGETEDENGKYAEQFQDKHTFANISGNHTIKVEYVQIPKAVKEIEDKEYKVGDVMRFTITQENPGALPLAVVITDPVSEHLEITSASHNGSIEENVIIWNLEIPAESSVTVTLNAKIISLPDEIDGK